MRERMYVECCEWIPGSRPGMTECVGGALPSSNLPHPHPCPPANHQRRARRMDPRLKAWDDGVCGGALPSSTPRTRTLAGLAPPSRLLPLAPSQPPPSQGLTQAPPPYHSAPATPPRKEPHEPHLHHRFHRWPRPRRRPHPHPRRPRGRPPRPLPRARRGNRRDLCRRPRPRHRRSRQCCGNPLHRRPGQRHRPHGRRHPQCRYLPRAQPRRNTRRPRQDAGGQHARPLSAHRLDHAAPPPDLPHQRHAPQRWNTAISGRRCSTTSPPPPARRRNGTSTNTSS